MKNVFKCLFLTLVLLLGVSSPARADSMNLIQNGGFETPIAPTATPYFTTISSPGGGSFVWSVPGATSVDVISTNLWPAFEGVQSLDLAGSTNNGGNIRQSFATIPGHNYLLSFEYANNPGIVATMTATANVEVDGTGTLLFTSVSHAASSATDLASMNYQLFSQTFTANSTLTTLTFTDTTIGTGGIEGIVLDAVSVTDPSAVPEPVSLLLWSLGGMSVLGWRRYRRSRVA